MGSPKPTLGYRSRTAAIEALRAQQIGTHEIARRIGISAKDVTALEASKIRTRRQRAGRSVPRTHNTVTFNYDLRLALRPHAVRRDMSVEALALEVLETAVFSDLVDAILDDEREM